MAMAFLLATALLASPTSAQGNTAPAITDPGDKSYAQGESVTAFAITVTDADGETPTVTVTGLPSDLSYDSGQVSGTVAADATAKDYTVTITANDGVNPDVTETFTVTVKRWKPAAPTLTRTTFDTPTDPALDVTWSSPPTGATIAGFEAQYRKQGVADWTSYSGTLSATTTSLNLPDLDAGATYEAQVRAYSSANGVKNYGDWSDTGEGTANRPPATTSASFSGGTFPVGTIADYKESGQGALGELFSDPDSDALTYSAAAQHPALLGVSLSGAAGSAHLRVTLLNQGSSKVTYTARDAYGGSVTRTATIGITAKVSRSIAEHSPAGTAVGAPVTGTPYNGAALSYSLTGKAASSGLFAIESATGQIKVATGATLDYETDDSHRETETWNGEVIAKFYRGKVGYTVDGHAAAIDVILKVTDVGAPKPAAPTVTRTEFSEPTSPALDVTWTAPAAGGQTITGYKAQYRKKAAAGEDPAAWTAYSGALGATATTFRLANLEAGATYEAQVRAVTSEEGESDWSDTGEGTSNRPPAATSASFSGGTFPVGTIADYKESGQGAVGVLFSDPDSDALTYSAAAQHPALLGVSLSGAAGSAHLRVTLLNQGSSKVTYTARDAYGGSVTRTATIGITAKVSRSIAERSPAGTAVGAPVTGTPYNGAALSYSLTGKAASSGLFVIESATGQIKVATGATLDYETDDSHRETETWNGEVIAKFYRGKVGYTVDGHAAAIDVILKVTDVGAPKPAAPTVTRTEFSEPTSPALDVTWTAPAAGGQTITGYKAQYRKKAAAGEDPAAWTAYSGALGATATTFRLASLEAGATYEAQVRAVTSEEGESDWSDTGEGTSNRPPTLTGTSIVNFSLQWYKFGNHLSSEDISTGYFQDSDEDALSYSASSQYPGVMKAWIDGGNLKVQTLNPTRAATTVTYGASDAYGGYVSRTVDVTGTMGTVQASIVENACCGRYVRLIKGVPYDDGNSETDDSLTYTLTGDAFVSGPFAHDAATGWISLGSGKSLDYETKSSYTATLSWVVQGQTASVTVNIKVTDLEAGKPNAPTLPRTEYSEPTDPGLDVTWTAPELTGEAINPPAHHWVRGPAPEEGGWRRPRVDPLQVRRSREPRHQNQPAVLDDHERDVAGPGRRLDLRGAGAGHCRSGRPRCLVGHRGGDGQPAAGRHQRVLFRRHVPGRHHRGLQGVRPGSVGGALLRPRQRRPHLLGRRPASGPARGQPVRRRRERALAGHAPESGLVEGDLHGPRRLWRIGHPHHDHRHHREGEPEHRRAFTRGHRGGRPGDRDALQRRGPDLLADGQRGEFGTVRHRVGHRTDQGGHGGNAGLRHGRYLPGDGNLSRKGDRQVLPRQSGVHGRRSRGRD